MGYGLPALAAVTDIGGTFLQDRLNTRARHDAQGFEANMYANRYQMQVADLEKAGLNPMLATGLSAGSAPSSSAQGISAPDVGGKIIAGRSTSAAVANVQQDTLKKAAETRNVDVDTLVKGGMIQQIAAVTANSLASADQARAMAEQIRAMIPKIEAEVKLIQTQQEKNKSDIRLNQSLVQANDILNSLRMAETVLKGQEAKIQQPRAEEYEKHKEAFGKSAAAADWMQNVYKMLNPFYHLSGGK